MYFMCFNLYKFCFFSARQWLPLTILAQIAFPPDHTHSLQNSKSVCKDWGLLKPTSPSLSIGHELNGLQDFQDSVNKMLQLPLIQRAFAQGQNKKWVDGLLTDLWESSKLRALLRMLCCRFKESAQGFQSVLCRSRGDETKLTSEVKKYIVSTL